MGGFYFWQNGSTWRTPSDSDNGGWVAIIAVLVGAILWSITLPELRLAILLTRNH